MSYLKSLNPLLSVVTKRDIHVKLERCLSSRSPNKNVGSLCSILVGCQPLFKVSLVPPGDKKNCQVGARHQENGEAGGKRWKAGDWGCHGGPWSGGRTGGTWAEGNQQYLRDMMAC